MEFRSLLSSARLHHRTLGSNMHATLIHALFVPGLADSLAELHETKKMER